LSTTLIPFDIIGPTTFSDPVIFVLPVTTNAYKTELPVNDPVNDPVLYDPLNDINEEDKLEIEEELLVILVPLLTLVKLFLNIHPSYPALVPVPLNKVK
jgi:hypothetical protein